MFHQQAGQRDIRQGIHRPHLVEVDLIDRDPVYGAFRVREDRIHAKDVLLHLFRYVHVFHPVPDLMHDAMGMIPVIMIVVMSVAVEMTVMMLMFMAVVMMMVFMFMDVIVMMVVLMVMIMTMVMSVHLLIFFFTVHKDLHMGAGDAAFHGRFGLQRHAGDVPPVEQIQDSVTVFAQFEQGGGHHVSGRAHAAVKKERPHFLTSM